MSKTPRIVLHNSETDALVDWLREAFGNADFRTCNTYDDMPDLLESYRPEIVYSVRFAGTPGFPRDAFFGPSGPKWLANGGAGTDHLGNWDTEQITVTNAAGVAADMMAEYILGSFLHFTLDVPGLLMDKEKRIWNVRTVQPVAGKTLLIVGLGHTGRAVAKRAKAFGMTVLGTRARPQETEHVDEVHAADDLRNLLPRADLIAVATPLIPATHGLIGADEIAAMKKGVILTDVSRGGVIDHTALQAAVLSGRISGAALDVFEEEPLPATSPLWALENVIISPHCSSVHADWEKSSFALFLENLKLWIRGEPLMNVVDPQRGY